MAQFISISIVVPTRERAKYLPHCLRTCLQSRVESMEIIVLDNASEDNTADIVSQFSDSRLRYVRNELRLSMRDNFEKGLQLASGDVICFLGDDDGLLSNAPAAALQLFRTTNVEALSTARAHYRWPDLFASGRNTVLIPRRCGVQILSSRVQLRTLLKHCDYYKLPCLYHGFVRKSLIHRVLAHQPRFFLSNQVDMFSAIALSSENIEYAFSETPLIINGSSLRSNGASHFGGGGSLERSLWKREDDLGFLPGFENAKSIGALIVESAIRYSMSNSIPLAQILDLDDARYVLERECILRQRKEFGYTRDQKAALFRTAGFELDARSRTNRIRTSEQRSVQLIKRFFEYCPITLDDKEIYNVYQCALCIQPLVAQRKVGFTSAPLGQFRAALRSLSPPRVQD